jgi:hypothetical protein
MLQFRWILCGGATSQSAFWLFTLLNIPVTIPSVRQAVEAHRARNPHFAFLCLQCSDVNQLSVILAKSHRGS